jgi:hypothetical protein
MTNRFRFLAPAIAICALATARPLPAQTPAADPELARAVAGVLADSMLSRGGGRSPVVWRPSALPLDSAVARALAGHPSFRGLVDGRTLRMRIVGATQQGDTARVEVERGSDLEGDEFPSFWQERTMYVFVRAGTGWRFARTEFMGHADGGPVRGE